MRVCDKCGGPCGLLDSAMFTSSVMRTYAGNSVPHVDKDVIAVDLCKQCQEEYLESIGVKTHGP